ncbi:isoprenylcysteine carboxylmethyltransferase family protein [Rhodoferax sp.]|uniref:methyltransferase family protein n=1 Tax=Rhodoferax sp. TaxID=50421 RepID=UPI0028507919|nr:isoprenylcysteine carboxylmethyltransferase family protein [Rhodoferax sp.]MDR3368428.1 isoprenylcysteine carboxylmethyltransferase family protein [Rhodoferax sp.]
MSPFSPTLRSRIGSLLVLLQFGLLIWLGILAAPQAMQGHMTLPCWVLLALSALLGGWTLMHNRLGNFNVHPEPKASGVMVTSGPYRLIRHPMYTTVLLGAAAMACIVGTWLVWLLWVALFAVLLVKSSLEEHWLREHHAQYASYCRQCKRFVPWVF